MLYVSPLKDAHQYDRTIVGDKAVNLSKLIEAGLPVPPGFLVLTPAYERFVTENGLQTEIERLALPVDPSRPASADQAANAIRELFERGHLPEEIRIAIDSAYQQLGAPPVAVRSSATAEDLPGASFAGLQETFLNITGTDNLLSTLLHCWASLWTARALIYRTRQHITSQSVRMAVIVQQMVEATSAGVLFTCNPVTGVQNEMVINASWGLGEAIVSGRVNPDMIVLDRESGQVKRSEIAEKLRVTVPTRGGVVEQDVPAGLRRQAVLSDANIMRLFQLGLAIEQLFHAPQDIEWALAEEQVFVLQARPITTKQRRQTVMVRQEDLSVPGDDSWNRQAVPQVQSFDLWTRVNIGENFPGPVTPLSETLWPAFFMLGRIPTKAERAPDAPPLPSAGQRFYGRLYVNEGAVIHGANQAGIPAKFLDTTWGSSGRGPRSSDEKFHFFRLLRTLPSIAKVGFQQAKQKPDQKPKTPKEKSLRGEQLFAQVDRWVEEFQQQDMRQLDDRALWDYWVPLWIGRGKRLRSILITAQLAAISFYLLESRLREWTDKQGQATILVQSLTGVYTAEVGEALWSMAQTLRSLHLDEIVFNLQAGEALALLQERPGAGPFLTEFQAFLRRHGYRCPNDAELYNPRWGEASEQVIDLIKSYLMMEDTANPFKVELHRQKEREELTTHIAGQLHPLRRRIFRWLLRQAQDKIRMRDNNRSYIAKFLYPMRLLLVEIGRRWAERGWLVSPDDIFFLSLYEIDDIIHTEEPLLAGEELLALLSARRAAFDYWNTIIAPMALGPGGIPLPDPEPTGSFLQGLPASAGRVRGAARLLRSLGEVSRLSQGDILVTQATDPGWTPVFPLVSGLVLEVGGQLSHGAIIAREYGIPAVINVPGALHNIQEGESIVVDGSNGRVYFERAGEGNTRDKPGA